MEEVNDDQKKILAERVTRRFGEDLSGRRFALWGLTFKPNTDDMRDAPSLEIVPALQQLGARVQAYDPEGMEEAKKERRTTDG